MRGFRLESNLSYKIKCYCHAGNWKLQTIRGTLMDILYTWKGFSTKKKAIIAGIIALIIIIPIVIACISSHYTATTMRLLRVQGTVMLETSTGSKPLKNNMRFQSGNALSTGEDGMASIGLDNDKVVTLQPNSRAEFTKARKKLEMTLTKGGAFFNVTRSLDADETFDIKTSTMVVAIRGTSGYVYVDKNGNPTIFITDGCVHVTGTNPRTGETKDTYCYAGQRVSVFILNGNTDTVVFTLDTLSEQDIPEFVLNIIANNSILLEKVCADTGWDPDLIKSLSKGTPDELPEETEETTLATPTPTSTPTPSPAPGTPTPEPEDDDDDYWDDDDDYHPTPGPTSGSGGSSSNNDNDDNNGSGSSSGSGSSTATPTPRPTSGNTPTPRPTSGATPTPRPSGATPTPRPSGATVTPTTAPAAATPTNTPVPEPPEETEPSSSPTEEPDDTDPTNSSDPGEDGPPENDPVSDDTEDN